MRGGEEGGEIGSDWSHYWQGLMRHNSGMSLIARGVSAKGCLPSDGYPVKIESNEQCWQRGNWCAEGNVVGF